MKKIAWFAPILLAGSVAFVACDGGGDDDNDGAGGSDGSGGKATGGSDGAGGKATGGKNGTGGSTGGNVGTTGGAGGEANGGAGGLGGMGGEGSQFASVCAAMCAAGVQGDASECDESVCVEICLEEAAFYESVDCSDEFIEQTECSAHLDADEYVCEADYVIVTGCIEEQQTLAACYN